MTNHPGKPNHLIHSSSPYLLQHAYNPVDWFPWGPEALSRAKNEDKPIILSIGYSSCHWCHVMERESFESEEIAQLMNDHFVSIKVDREERPDIDQIYMDAVQAMGVHGGWPLNVFLTPDQKPFYGGTYFRPTAWKQLLSNIYSTYRENKMEVMESAEKFREYIDRTDIEKYDLQADDSGLSPEDLAEPMQKTASRFDKAHGGFSRAPKFPMPGLWKFILHYATLTGQSHLADHVLFTLRKMANGGIFDQLGGGFARYSVDSRWMVPHFEKMLYDNVQLIDLYAYAYRVDRDPLFAATAGLIFEFLERELSDPSGGFYSALDADSEGMEGKYYTWTADEFDRVCKEDSEMMREYWGVTGVGNWEDGRNILYVDVDENRLAEKYRIPPVELRARIQNARRNLMEIRNRRDRPGLDNKVLTAWNGLAVTALVNAYLHFRDEKYLRRAVIVGNLIAARVNKINGIPRSLVREDSAQGFLDDAAFSMEAFISLYKGTHSEKWMSRAGELTEYVIAHFYDTREELFFYTGHASEQLIARKKEIFDNVIPGSNSVMAGNLFLAGKILDRDDYLDLSQKMMRRMQKLFLAEPEYLYRWGDLYCGMSGELAEIVVVGPDFREVSLELGEHISREHIILAAEREGNLPLFRSRTAINGKTTIYVCYDKTCRLPVHSVTEALSMIK